MEKVIVIGCPGAGKSTFARKLRDKTKLPLFYLDRIWHKPDRTTVTREEFDARLDAVLSEPRYIIDGNYSRTLEKRVRACDTVFFFDLPTEDCLSGAQARVGTVHEDLPWIETEFDPEFRDWILDFKREKQLEIERLLSLYGEGKRVVVFHSRAEADAYLDAEIPTVYYRDEEIVIRDLTQPDARIITDGEIEQGWHAEIDKYEMRLRDRAEGRAHALCAEYHGAPAGYINVYPSSMWGAFGGQGLPEIVDFGVLEKYRRRGIGAKLMDAAEEIAGRYADTVYLGVGVHSGYGSAQRMYVKRGYLPDGSGAWYGDSVCPQYAPCCNDDSLILYLSKKLR